MAVSESQLEIPGQEIARERERIWLAHLVVIVHHCSNQLLPPKESFTVNMSARADFKRGQRSLGNWACTLKGVYYTFQKKNLNGLVTDSGILLPPGSGWGDPGGVKDRAAAARSSQPRWVDKFSRILQPRVYRKELAHFLKWPLLSPSGDTATNSYTEQMLLNWERKLK